MMASLLILFQLLCADVLTLTRALSVVNDGYHQHNQHYDAHPKSPIDSSQFPLFSNNYFLSQPLSILFENDRILAIDKPSGISHHDSGLMDDDHDDDPSQHSQKAFGILSHLRQLQTLGKLQHTGRLFGVHRLDQVTSGILLLAKDAGMASQLTRAFREGRVTKYYVGLSQRSSPPKKQGWIRGHMVRGRRKTWLLTPNTPLPQLPSSDNKAGNDPSSHPPNNNINNMAVTRFFTAGLGNLPPPTTMLSTTPVASPRTCILFRPYTGRTHQLRVAAKAMGLALLGDPLYRDGSSSHLADQVSSIRTCLHAAGLHVQLEGDASPITIWSRPPFGQLFWNDTSTIESFDQVTLRLMDKHCDCPALRELLLLEQR